MDVSRELMVGGNQQQKETELALEQNIELTLVYGKVTRYLRNFLRYRELDMFVSE